MLHWYKTGITKTLVVVTLLLLASSTRGQEDGTFLFFFFFLLLLLPLLLVIGIIIAAGHVQEESDRLFLGKSDDNSTVRAPACRVDQRAALTTWRELSPT